MLHKIKSNEFKRASEYMKARKYMPVFSFGVGQVIGKTQRPNARSLNFVGHTGFKTQSICADTLLAGHFTIKTRVIYARLPFGLAVPSLKSNAVMPNLNFPANGRKKTTKLMPDTFYLGHSKSVNQDQGAQVS